LAAFAVFPPIAWLVVTLSGHSTVKSLSNLAELVFLAAASMLTFMVWRLATRARSSRKVLGVALLSALVAIAISMAIFVPPWPE
jgi:hypothetical protein